MLFRSRRFRAETGGCLGCTVVAEDAASERVVAANEHFVVAVPFAPHWPYEIHVRARRHGARRIGDLEPGERRSLAAALRANLARRKARARALRDAGPIDDSED